MTVLERDKRVRRARAIAVRPCEEIEHVTLRTIDAQGLAIVQRSGRAHLRRLMFA